MNFLESGWQPARMLIWTTVISNSNKTFSIASLLVVTTLVAVHAAFPSLLVIWWIGLGFAVALFCVMLPLLAMVALMSPPSADGQLDVGKNGLLRGLLWLYVALVAGVFLVAIMHFVRESLFQAFSPFFY